MIAGAATSTDDHAHVHEEEFVCLYDVCEEAKLEDADDQVLYY